MKKSLAIAQQLKRAETAFGNSQTDAAISALVVKYGFTSQRLKDGINLHSTAVSAVDDATAAVGARRAATEHVAETLGEARDAYQSLAKVSRAIFKGDEGILTALGLDKPMPRPAAAFAQAAHTLFNSGSYTPPMRDKLAGHGYDSAKLSTERGRIGEFNFAKSNQESAKGAAQQAKQDQRTALKELRGYYSTYVKVARVALREKPELIETIGVLHRSTRTKAQRQGPKKAAETRRRKKKAQFHADDSNVVNQ